MIYLREAQVDWNSFRNVEESAIWAERKGEAVEALQDMSSLMLIKEFYMNASSRHPRIVMNMLLVMLLLQVVMMIQLILIMLLLLGSSRATTLKFKILKSWLTQSKRRLVVATNSQNVESIWAEENHEGGEM